MSSLNEKQKLTTVCGMDPWKSLVVPRNQNLGPCQIPCQMFFKKLLDPFIEVRIIAQSLIVKESIFNPIQANCTM